MCFVKTLCNSFRSKKKKKQHIDYHFTFYLSLAPISPVFFLYTPLFPLLSRLIESSLGSVATKFNFFIHNLAQLRFSGLPANDEPILSFSPKTYTLKQEGRIIHASIYSFQKRYNPDKHYVSFIMSRLS